MAGATSATSAAPQARAGARCNRAAANSAAPRIRGAFSGTGTTTPCRVAGANGAGAAAAANFAVRSNRGARPSACNGASDPVHASAQPAAAAASGAGERAARRATTATSTASAAALARARPAAPDVPPAPTRADAASPATGSSSQPCHASSWRSTASFRAPSSGDRASIRATCRLPTTQRRRCATSPSRLIGISPRPPARGTNRTRPPRSRSRSPISASSVIERVSQPASSASRAMTDSVPVSSIAPARSARGASTAKKRA